MGRSRRVRVKLPHAGPNAAGHRRAGRELAARGGNPAGDHARPPAPDPTRSGPARPTPGRAPRDGALGWRAAAEVRPMTTLTSAMVWHKA